VAQQPIFTPFELEAVTNCTLQYHFLQQLPSASKAAENEVPSIEVIVRDTIQHLHASGGPFRLNLPTILRYAESAIPEAFQNHVPFTAAVRQMVANYHRRLKDEWPQVIASNEYVTLPIRLRGAVVQVEAVIDRLDKERDGGITAVNLIASPQAAPNVGSDHPIELTMIHALAAAAYPQKRPVRIRNLWLYRDKTETIELTETQYRQNLEKMRARLQVWLGGEVLARPGLYCDDCPFQYRGCPIYPDETPEKPTDDLSDPSLPATLSPRRSYTQEALDLEETENPDS
jgi:hypothetical protein